MRLISIALITTGLVFLAIKLLLDLLLPLGFICLILGIIFYFVGDEKKPKVKVLNDK